MGGRCWVGSSPIKEQLSVSQLQLRCGFLLLHPAQAALMEFGVGHRLFSGLFSGIPNGDGIRYISMAPGRRLAASAALSLSVGRLEWSG